jgi:hypothetical protein
MTLDIVLILIASKIVILSVTGAILWKVMGPELRAPRPKHGMPGVRCVYCHDSPALFHSEEQRWEDNELVLVRTYECRRCHMPFWLLERVDAVAKKPV